MSREKDKSDYPQEKLFFIMSMAGAMAGAGSAYRPGSEEEDPDAMDTDTVTDTETETDTETDTETERAGVGSSEDTDTDTETGLAGVGSSEDFNLEALQVAITMNSVKDSIKFAFSRVDDKLAQMSSAKAWISVVQTYLLSNMPLFFDKANAAEDGRMADLVTRALTEIAALPDLYLPLVLLNTGFEVLNGTEQLLASPDIQCRRTLAVFRDFLMTRNPEEMEKAHQQRITSELEPDIERALSYLKLDSKAIARGAKPGHVADDPLFRGMLSKSVQGDKDVFKAELEAQRKKDAKMRRLRRRLLQRLQEKRAKGELDRDASERVKDAAKDRVALLQLQEKRTADAFKGAKQIDRSNLIKGAITKTRELSEAISQRKKAAAQALKRGL